MRRTYLSSLPIIATGTLLGFVPGLTFAADLPQTADTPDTVKNEPASPVGRVGRTLEKTIDKTVKEPIKKMDRAIHKAFEPEAKPQPKVVPILLQSEGMDEALFANVSAHLEALEKTGLTTSQADRARTEEAAYTAMRALGHYRPHIVMTLKKEKAGVIPLEVVITPDKPVTIAETNVRILGEADRDPAFLDHLKTLPARGTRLNHGDYESFKQGLSSIAASKGYFDAEFLRNELGVSLGRREAFWSIDFASGPRYAFGDVRFEGSQIKTDFLDNIVPFEPGEPFSAEELAELSRRLSNTGWFDSFIVAPDFEAAALDPEHRLPVSATVTPRKANSIELGVGYATDVGPRTKVTWKKPWVNSLGHKLSLSTELSKEEPTIDTNYQIPLRHNPLEEYWLIQGGYKHTDLNDTDADTASFSLSRWWEFGSGWQRSVRVRGSYDKFTQASESHSTFLLYPGISFSRLRSRGGAMPYWADSQRYSVDFASKDLGSDASFWIFRAQQSWIRTYMEKHRFIVRGEAGYIETEDFDRVPPDLRFFAGGDRSIRGYKYKSISPKNADGSLTGASALLTGSIEYQYNVTGKWWTALFYDVGEAVNGFHKSHFKDGVGMGVRWLSPIGPVKFDLAVPLDNEETDDFQILIGLGAEL